MKALLAAALVLGAALPSRAEDSVYTPPPPPSNWTQQQKLGYQMGTLGVQMLGQGLQQMSQPQQQSLPLPPSRDGGPTEVEQAMEENRRRLQQKMGGDGSRGMSFRVDDEEPKPCKVGRSCDKAPAAPEAAPEAVAAAKPKPKKAPKAAPAAAPKEAPAAGPSKQ